MQLILFSLFGFLCMGLQAYIILSGLIVFVEKVKGKAVPVTGRGP
jgi:hypothetical protein